ncbi:alpha/beta hydrolase [Enterovibrio coralii]|uniref:Esterase n=1 Tax=Enterovibrio coralii TaxID=294935 RepID=A0A135I817_9GAMM|nr:alpha/beta hydrolase [Enterovibrio coralii]KXF81593.1 hypothetical protein ATN88_02645 [Enterovibrio coralii]
MRQLTLFSVVLSFLFATMSYANESRLQYFKIDAPSLAGNKLNTPTEQFLYVYLPPSYFTSDKAYPVVYYLHGFGGGAMEARAISGSTLDKFSAKHQFQEMIIVGVNGSNQFGGGFFVNSPVSGNWEDFVTSDVLSYVDSNFRTMPSAENRGIVGFSMGGFGAVNIALRHPDKFQHLFALSPGLFDQNGLIAAVNQWQQQNWTAVLNAYAAAFSPNADGSEGNWWYAWNPNDPVIVEQWEAGYGQVEEKVDAYLQKTQRLANIHVEYGSDDEFPWIPEGSQYLVATLKGKGVDVSEHDHGGGHVISFRQAESIIRYFAEAF